MDVVVDYAFTMAQPQQHLPRKPDYIQQLTPAWKREASPQVSSPRRTPEQQRSAHAAVRELTDRAAALQSDIGRAALLASLDKWTRYAERKLADGLVALGRMEPRQEKEMARMEDGVAAAAWAKSTFMTAASVIRQGGWKGHERQIVLEVDEARCRLINCVA